jgi:hypothetical protein
MLESLPTTTAPPMLPVPPEPPIERLTPFEFEPVMVPVTERPPSPPPPPTDCASMPSDWSPLVTMV